MRSVNGRLEMHIHGAARWFVVLLVAAASAATRPAVAAETRQIFDGTTLEGWEGTAAHWRVEDAAITGEIPAGETLARNEFLWWKGTAGDFDLELEFRITGGPKANSGVQFRSERLPDGHAKGYQADLDDGTLWAGRIYDEHGRGLLVERGTRLAIAPDGRKWADVFAAPDAVKAAVRPGDWNRYRIRCTAAHTTVWLNDELAAVLDDRDAKQAEFTGPRGELVGVDRAAGGDADRVGVVRRALLQQRAHARDDDPGAFGAQAPRHLEAAAHRLDARAHPLEGQRLPRRQQRDVAIAEVGGEVVAEHRRVGPARHHDEHELAVDAPAEARDRECPGAVRHRHGGVACAEVVGERAVVREGVRERGERCVSRRRVPVGHGRPTGR